MLHPQFALIPFLFMGLAAARADDPPPIFDKRPYAQAKKQAEDARKWFIVFATSARCRDCEQMNRTIWRDEAVVEWLGQNAVAVSLDMNAQPDLVKELAIEKMGTILAFRDGKEFDRVDDRRERDKVLEWIKSIERGESTVDILRRRAEQRNEQGKLDIRARLDLARKLAKTGKIEAAADEYVWLWENMLEHDPSFAVRGSFMALDMERLAAKSPDAKSEFTKLRDQAGQAMQADGAEWRDTADWITLNRVIGDNRATFAWYGKAVAEPRWRSHIDRMTHSLETLFIKEARWADLGRLYQQPTKELERHFGAFDDVEQKTPKLTRDQATEVQKTGRALARERSGCLYAGLLAADRDVDAEKFADSARKLDASTDMLRALISSALRANEPREIHLQWIDRAGKNDELTRTRAELSAALEKK